MDDDRLGSEDEVSEDQIFQRAMSRRANNRHANIRADAVIGLEFAEDLLEKLDRKYFKKKAQGAAKAA